MKGITPIIAIMLLLMITIAMIGFAYLWFTRISQNAMNRTENIMEQNRENLGKTIQIDNAIGAADSMVFIRNTGSFPINVTEIKTYVAGALVSCDFTPILEIAPGEIKGCNIMASNCAGYLVKVSAPGNFDEFMCR